MRKSITLLALLLLVSTNAANAQSVAVQFQFLMIQPSVRANGMGGASVASSTDNALAVAFNPAHLGLIQTDRQFTTRVLFRKDGMGFRALYPVSDMMPKHLMPAII